jgi:large-conductance mechanosensitive channel
MNTITKIIDINPFISFIGKFNIIPLAFSIIISLNLNQLSNTFIETIISPIINKIFVNSDIRLKDRKIIILGVKFEIGQFLSHLIQFVFTLIMLYFIYLFYLYISSDTLELPYVQKQHIL